MRIPRRLHLASAALPAASAFTTQSFFDIPAGAASLTFYVTYAEGADGGQPELQFQWSNGAEISRQLVIDGATGLAVVAPNGAFEVQMSRTIGPDPEGATIDYIIRAKIPAGSTSVRLQAREVGVVGTPGTMQIALTGDSDDGGEMERVDGVGTPSGAIPAAENFIVPRTLHLDNGAGAATTLPAAGAFTSQSTFAIPAGLKKIAFDCVYTRGAAGGFPVYNILWGDGTVETRAIVVDQNSLAIAGDDGEFNVYQEQILGPAPIDGNPIEYKLEYEVPAGETEVRLLAAERGATATPGDLLITLTGRG